MISKYKGELGLIIVAIIWGSGFVASDVALGFFTSFQVMAIRFTIGALAMSIVFYKKFKTITKKTIFYGVLIGCFLYFAFLMQTIGLIYTTPSKNAFLTAVNVVLVPFIGLIFLREKIDFHGLIGAFLAVIGVGFISFNLDMSINIGDLLTLLCAVGFAFHIFFTGEFLKRGADPIHLTIVQMVTASLISIAFMIFFKDTYQPLKETNATFNTALFSTIYLGLFSTTIAFLLQTVSQKFTSSTKTAIILSTESVFGSLLSIIILGENITLRLVIGSIIIFSAIIISETKPTFGRSTVNGNN